MQELEAIWQQAKDAISTAADLKTLDDYRVTYLGKKGQLTSYLKQLGQLPAEERPAAGQRVNALKEALQKLIEERAEELKKILIDQKIAEQTIDITLPGRTAGMGSLHPVAQTSATLRRIFTQMGFEFVEGPEIEDDYHNFSALNVPPLHPARAMQDTFYFPDGMLLRTQTSPLQIRAMKRLAPPLRIVTMGRVYRRDFDVTHTPMFHQLECLMVAEKISFAHLKSVLTEFLHAFFSAETPIRLRPSYFPFTEPSAEVDIGCFKCAGKGCRLCKHTGWIEVLGCGMVHPNVFKAVGIDSTRYRGFAFGVGIDRLTMLKYGISDLRSLFENDIRFLKQF